MKKLRYVLLLCAILCCTGTTAYAYSTPSGGNTTSSGGSVGGGTGEASVPSGSSGTIEGSVNQETGEMSAEIDFPFSVYTPKVTYIKSVNAALANYDGAPVYFMPKLEDFPTPLENVVSDLTDNRGVRHQFAAVYTGYFDTDVEYISAEANSPNNARLMTSKKVYSAEDNSRLLNLLGYDLLLQREAFDISVVNGQINMSYNPTRIPTNELSANTCVMDLYKAMGIYEWDIEFAYGVDKDLNIEQSPILQMIPAITSGEKNKGYDTSESVVWVAATRTNPEQYWNRCLQDAIFDGGLHSLTAPVGSYIGSESSVSFSLNSNDEVTLGQFCALARAIMNLYGEPVMTEAEQDACLLAYGVSVPKNSYTKEIRDSIIYLSAKGIIDPSQKNFSKNVTFSDIEDILLRIADKDSRLTVKTQNISLLSNKGFSSVRSVTLPENDASIEMIESEDLQYYDFLVELNDMTMFYMLRSTQGFVTESNGKPTANYRPLVTSANPVENGTRAQSTENIAILKDNVPVNQQSGFWRNVGIEEYTDIGGKDRTFYHFKINTDQFQTLHFVSSDTYNEGIGTEFTLPNSDGGIYYYDNGWQYATFADYNFDNTYRDINSTSFTEFPIPLTTNKKFASLLVSADNVTAAKERTQYDNGYTWMNLYDQSGAIKRNERVTVSNSLMVMVMEVDNGFRFELYGTHIENVLGTEYVKSLLGTTGEQKTSNAGFYRAEDNTLLIGVDYLRSKSKITAFQNITDTLYLMSVNSIFGKNVATNVVISNDKDHGFIMVGDTLYTRKNGEVLIENVAGDYYVNAKALIGWANDLILIPTGNAGVMAIDATLYNTGVSGIAKTSGTTIKVKTLAGASSNVLGVLNNVLLRDANARTNSNFSGQGITLASAYPLSNYILVSGDNNTDYIFIYHIRGLEGADDSGDSDARNLFADLTGFQLDPDPVYYLKVFPLDRVARSENIFNAKRNEYYTTTGNVFRYVSTKFRGKTMGTQEVTWGWTYSPMKTDDLTEAAKEYAAGNTSYILPFAYYKNSVYDLNLNVCKSSPTASGFEPIGTLPGYMYGNPLEKIGKLENDGSKVFSDVPSGNVFSDYKVTAAPVGNFYVFKAGSDSTLSEISSRTIYWGTTPITYNRTRHCAYVGNVPVKLEDDAPVISTFVGASLNSVWAIKTSEANIASLSSGMQDLLDSAITRDASRVVDWDKYTFNRLIENLDSWSSIVLIFILNILPRVCVLLFFLLMLLSLITSVKIWRNFCNNVFDVYKFLTLGHQTVETVNTKRLFLTSIICLALFYMIMDGALFNFILWVCEWVLVLMQN